ncbi:MAG: hypothetical protein KHZ60_10310 [Alistipes sp.]|uniref:hypothetical protein n=2 Tax=Alistipes TaxID=239759 RepID=UPI001DB8F94F|nr:hypothetical protein [Alistipes sp.]MBS5020444.1 hypothetical protein [Alistipes sp.]
MNGNAIDGKSPFYEMRSIPEQGNVLKTELSFDNAVGWPFEKPYRENRDEKQPDYQYYCTYWPVLRIVVLLTPKDSYTLRVKPRLVAGRKAAEITGGKTTSCRLH